MVVYGILAVIALLALAAMSLAQSFIEQGRTEPHHGPESKAEDITPRGLG